MSEPEQRHIISAFAFELGKVETLAVRKRMLGHLMIIDKALGHGVEAALGMEGAAEDIIPARKPIDLDPSPSLSLVKKAEPTLKGRKVAALVTDGVDDGLLASLRSAIEKEGARLAIVAPKIAGVTTGDGKKLPADQALSGAPSILFDAVARGRRHAREGSGRRRLAARCLRASQGHRPCRRCCAGVREGFRRARC